MDISRAILASGLGDGRVRYRSGQISESRKALLFREYGSRGATCILAWVKMGVLVKEQEWKKRFNLIRSFFRDRYVPSFAIL